MHGLKDSTESTQMFTVPPVLKQMLVSPGPQ